METNLATRKMVLSVVISAIFSLLLGLTFLPQTVHAYVYETYSTKNVYGVSYQKYWPTGSTTAWQRQQINDQMYRWNTSNGTGLVTPINVTIGSNQAQSILDYYYDAQGYKAPDVTGTTFHFYGDNQVSFTNSNWTYAQMHALGTVYNTQPNSIKIQTWAHETGHGFGLAHNNDSSHPSVMRQVIDGSFNGPTINDLKGINYLYN
ncbi:reprolysin-like metallopeptidase [Schleiferilactobacillus shenzhenensis]|nr:matrixin family metalloprotease [Schleiferilactobacillus shenzhenensis]